MDFFRRTKGVISVFLIIIMLPLLTSAVILVDGTRYHSAKTMVQEAGDLAAYSTIANYNQDLKEQFGLFAIDDKELTATFKKYFTETLGYSESEAESYSQKVQGLISSAVFKGGQYKNANFFNMYNFEVTNATATGIHPLSDPGVLQNQIVEYSKYRGVETILERFEILSKFDKVDEETKASQNTMAAIENLSAIEESYVSTVSGGAKDLKISVENFNASISVIYDKMDTFYDCVAEELAAFAVKDSSLYNKKQARVNAYNNLISHLDQLITDADYIYNEATYLSSDAQLAIDKLNTFINNHPDQTDACKTAQEDIKCLKQMIEQTDSKFSLWNLKKGISRQQMETLKSSIVNKIKPLLTAIQTTYTNYQTDKNNAEDQSTVRYHFNKKNGGEWYGTEEDHTSDGSKLKDFVSNAGVVVEEYVGVINRNTGKIGSISVDSYKKGFKNSFQDYAENAAKTDKQMSSSDAANKANSAKKDTAEEKAHYATISAADAALLPSKCASEQSEIDIPDVNGDSASSTLSSANSNASSIMSKFLETGRNDALVYCYLLDNFKTRVTEKGINSSTEHSGIADNYLADWRYAEPNGEIDMRYRAKKDLDTFFATNEVEYVFGGCKSEFANATIVYSWIYGTRFINNFAAVYSAYASGDSWIRLEIDGLAAAASAATLGAVPFSVFKWVFITAWAAGETALDLSLLIDDGYKIPLIKTKNNIFINSVTEIGNAFSSESRRNYVRNPNSTSQITDKINVSYEDYLLILLAFVGRETRLERIGDLIQLNMRKRCDSNFVMSSAYTYIKADTTVKIKYMFQPVKQFKGSYNGTGLKFNNTIYQGY